MEDVEIPEASSTYERHVALTIAIMAVVLAVISQKGDNAKGDSLLAATRASNQWAYFQSKSIKEHSYVMQKEILGVFNPSAVDSAKLAPLTAQYEQNAKKYEKEKEEIQKKAEEYEKDILANAAINDRCDLAGLMLQIAIVFCSVAILVEWPLLWYTAICLGLGGAVAGVFAFMM